MGFWTNKEHRTPLDDAEDLAYTPSGGRAKMWVLGVALALVPAGYGIYCLRTGHALMFGQNDDLDVTGSSATALAIAYIAVGVFMHAHWFWGLHSKGESMSYLLKFLSVLLFLGSFGYAIYKIAVT